VRIARLSLAVCLLLCLPCAARQIEANWQTSAKESDIVLRCVIHIVKTESRFSASQDYADRRYLIPAPRIGDLNNDNPAVMFLHCFVLRTEKVTDYYASWKANGFAICEN
jgi:hypothetical protein